LFGEGANGLPPSGFYDAPFLFGLEGTMKKHFIQRLTPYLLINTSLLAGCTRRRK